VVGRTRNFLFKLTALRGEDERGELRPFDRRRIPKRNRGETLRRDGKSGWARKGERKRTRMQIFFYLLQSSKMKVGGSGGGISMRACEGILKSLEERLGSSPEGAENDIKEIPGEWVCERRLKGL